MKIILTLICFCAALSAQLFGPPTQFRKVTVATLPSGVATGHTVQVTDGANTADCGTGGGSTRVWCTWNGAAWQAMSGTGGGDGTEIKSAATSGGDNRLMRAVGDSRNFESTTVQITDTNQISAPGGFVAGDGTVAGESQHYELTANGTDYFSWLAPDSISTTQRLKLPAAANAANQTLKFGAPSSNISTATWDYPLWAGGVGSERVTGLVMYGTGGSSAIQTTDDITSVLRNMFSGSATITINDVWCETDTGSVNIQLQKDDGTATDMLSANLACSTSGANTTSFVSGENVLATGDRVDFVVVSIASGTPTKVSLFYRYTVN